MHGLSRADYRPACVGLGAVDEGLDDATLVRDQELSRDREEIILDRIQEVHSISDEIRPDPAQDQPNNTDPSNVSSRGPEPIDQYRAVPPAVSNEQPAQYERDERIM
jgi:hypothetical protein